MSELSIFEKSVSGRQGYSLPELDVPASALDSLLPARFLRKDPPLLPEISEVDVVRHFTNLSRDNYGVDQGFYPLGSCTMKYNPKINEEAAQRPGFVHLHPLQPEDHVQGALEVMYELSQALAEITGMDRVTLQPAAGAQGELAGMLMVRAYHRHRRDPRRKVIIPDSAHGTNPATARLAGFEVVVVHSNRDGLVDLDDLKKLADRDTAALMLTNPNTLGLFERDIVEIARVVHEAGALLYLDGANLNALLGISRPGDMGFDVVHSNLHKTFTTPHGGGGPGAGALAVRRILEPHLPVPVVEKTNKGFRLIHRRPGSIGRVHGFYGNFSNLVRAFAYIRMMGADGLREVGENAILNANYLRKRLEVVYSIPYNRMTMHEFVISVKRFREKDVHAWDIGKRLIDYGFYPPTVNFPLIVDEALMIEPTETESKQTLDRFCEAMEQIAGEVDKNPEVVRTAPHTRSVSRLDEARAVKSLNLRWKPG